MAKFGWTFCVGDKVMQAVNDYDRDVFNGDLGVISSLDLEAGELSVTFDGREVTYGFGGLDELVLAYATTIHKSQGSEYPAVVIPLCTQHYAMLARNLLYTGLTRGKRFVVLVGQRRALALRCGMRPASALVDTEGVAQGRASAGVTLIRRNFSEPTADHNSMPLPIDRSRPIADCRSAPCSL